MHIVKLTFDKIKTIWETKLWAGRALIEPQSAMLYLEGHSMDHFSLPVYYLGAIEDGKLVGVNSGHLCSDGSFRSRGLWVDPEYRGRGFGTALLKDTIARGEAMSAKYCWSFPRKTSWPSYERAGFYLTTEWKSSDTSEANAFCRYDYP